MSGHSHWSTIKHKKEASDAKRGQMFSKLARQITVAVKESGGNPETNSKLRFAIDEAKSINMPTDNVERAVKRGQGAAEGETNLEELTYEAYGPAGIALIIEGITDNKNRTLGEIKQILNQNGGKMVDSGAVQWLFERKGVLIIDFEKQEDILKNKEDLELLIIEKGAEDIRWLDNLIYVYTKPEALETFKQQITSAGVKIESLNLEWVAKEEMDLPETNRKKCEKLFEELDENEAVQNIYSNLKI